MNKHNWTSVKISPKVPVWVCQNCQGVKVKDYNGQFTYFYQNRIKHC
ncbi:MAG: hypothetical protein MRERV_16c041 [Mycoplasmataceae bacterium RV_VA103A]|nr:MAG: hypothetical protein MRERV_16c041 [Mycoplasmataceae bacterium RV_VA103A]